MALLSSAIACCAVLGCISYWNSLTTLQAQELALARDQNFADKFNALQVSPQDLLANVREDGRFIARNRNLDEALKTRLSPG
jgi:hypothetical protein